MEHPVSVVISTYNGASYIHASLESVLAQTQLPVEIIVVDDGSKDDTQAIVKSVAAKSPVPIRQMMLDKNSGGPSGPLNLGIDAAESELIALLDQDDLMRPRRIEAQKAALLENPECSLVIGRFAILGANDDDGLSQMWPVPQFHGLSDAINPHKPYSVVDSETAFKPLLRRNYAGSSSSFFFTRQQFRAMGQFDANVTTCGDLDLMFKATLVGPIAIVNEIVFDYRWSATSLQRKDLTRSLLEATMVRLRAASEKPEWAGADLADLRQSALLMANAAVRKGDFQGLRALAETFSKHKGLEAVKNSLDNKVRRLVR